MLYYLKIIGYQCSVKDCGQTFALFSECRQHSAECKRKGNKQHIHIQ